MNRHGDTASAFCMQASGPVDLADLRKGIAALQRSFGPDLLRIKGLIEVSDSPGCPIVLHVVGHVASPMRRLDGWPDGIDATRLVLIVSGPRRDRAAKMLYRFVPEFSPFSPAETPLKAACS